MHVYPACAPVPRCFFGGWRHPRADRILECFSLEIQAYSSSSLPFSASFPGLGFSRMSQSLKAESCLQMHAMFSCTGDSEIPFGALTLFIPKLLKIGACPANGRNLKEVEALQQGPLKGGGIVTLGDRSKKGL